ncbi:SdpI family protein [Corynebacterium sp. NPDC060344]|uniref:SdpI family protein n=1 Tax=Corynebacterium sp. NPDC060344 TaxID=3347101 RepID=UPI00365E44B9
MMVIPVILLVVALVVAVVAGLAWSAKLPGNSYVGIRAPEARKSREYWDITHRVAGPPWAVSALAFAGAAALAFVAIRPEASGWMWLWVAVAGLLGLAMLGVGGAIGSHTIALYDAKKSAENDSAGCCSSGGSAGAGADAGACGSGCGCGSAEAATGHANTGADACCTPAEAAAADAPRDPSADCGVTGGCGSCSLNGMCEDGNATFGSAAVDRDALRRAARANDGK